MAGNGPYPARSPATGSQPTEKKEIVMPEDVVLASLKEVRYFGISGKDMITQWRDLTDEDKRQLREGLGSGTLTY